MGFGKRLPDSQRGFGHACDGKPPLFVSFEACALVGCLSRSDGRRSSLNLVSFYGTELSPSVSPCQWIKIGRFNSKLNAVLSQITSPAKTVINFQAGLLCCSPGEPWSRVQDKSLVGLSVAFL